MKFVSGGGVGSGSMVKSGLAEAPSGCVPHFAVATEYHECYFDVDDDG